MSSYSLLNTQNGRKWDISANNVDLISLNGNGTSGQVLSSNGPTVAPSWVTASAGGSSVLVSQKTTTSYTSLTTNSTWTKLATIAGSSIFTGVGNYSLNWGFSSTETNKFNALLFSGYALITPTSQNRPLFCVPSFDGTTWNSLNSPSTQVCGSGYAVNNIVYNSTLKFWLANSGYANQPTGVSLGYGPFWISKNGREWSLLCMPDAAASTCFAINDASPTSPTICFGMSAGASNKIYYTVGSIGKGIIATTQPVNKISYANMMIWAGGSIAKFVVVGAGYGGAGQQASEYSSDGITWTLSSNYSTVYTAISGITIAVNTANTLIVSGRANGTMCYSTNGTSWTDGTITGSTYNFALVFANSIWVRTGIGSSPVHYSTDGITWTASTTLAGITSGCALAWYAAISKWVLVGFTGGTTVTALWTSTDAITWVIQTTDYFNSLVYGYGACLASGVVSAPKNMEVGVVVKDTTTGTSQYPLNYGVNGDNGLGRQCGFDSVSGSASASDTINITSYNAGTMDIEIWGKLDADTPISYGTTPSLTLTISASSFT
jgi:hypothetical protein